MRDWKECMKSYGCNLVSEGLIIQLTPDEEGLDDCRELGSHLIK